jgi:hypothetical protein
MFHDEDYEQTNRETRDFIDDLNNQVARNNPVSLDIYITGINASIKAGNPDNSLIEEVLRLVDNDPSNLHKNLVIKIHKFDLNRV